MYVNTYGVCERSCSEDSTSYNLELMSAFIRACMKAIRRSFENSRILRHISGGNYSPSTVMLSWRRIIHAFFSRTLPLEIARC